MATDGHDCVPDTPENAANFWKIDEADVLVSDIVLVYAVDGDVLRGALVEAGMAIAYGVPVAVVGTSESYGTWQYHPMVKRFETLPAFLLWAEARANNVKSAAK